MTEDPLYTMSIDMNVLTHLGIGLYSNVPAVLSELVANAWDADAKLVTIDIDKREGRIIITDTGNGMTRDEINRKYLKVGYQRRKEDPLTQQGRYPMGRKGIGKLSVFSIANTVDVYSAKNGEVSGLRMSLPAISALIADGGTKPYHPDPLDTTHPPIEIGTRIVLSGLRKRVDTAEKNLRRRLARRFSVIGGSDEFEVVLNGLPIGIQDRDYISHIEFLWYFGEESEDVIQSCTDLQRAIPVENRFGVNGEYKVKGWIGTVDEQKYIDETNNTIVVLARGKLIQEDVLTALKEGGFYSKYIIGEINADYMDEDDEADIVTSNRQSVDEDDVRYEALKVYIKSILKQIQREWSELRTEGGVERALQIPVVKEWYDRLKGDNKTYARRLFSRIESLRIPDPASRKEIYKASLIAFETMALKDSLSVLDNLETERDFELITKVFAGIDELEAVHYYNIVKGRLGVIRDFVDMLPHTRERVV